METMKEMKEIENEKQTETDEEETESETEKITTKIRSHRFHEHPMIFKPGVVGPDNSLGCGGCRRLIDGSHYACSNEGCKFVLHEFCFNLPGTLSEHPLHPQHELLMLRGPPEYLAECKVCGKYCKGFTYHCMKCPRFDMDLLCAWVPWNIQTRAHEHSFSLIPQPAIFSCNACTVKLENMTFSYMCFTCKYWVHLDCALGPPNDNLTRLRHNHPLDLLALRCIKCELCKNETEGDSSECSEFDCCGCQSCKRYFHNGCLALATLSSKSIEETIERLSPELYFSPKFLEFTKSRAPYSLEIEHWSHRDHPLELQRHIAVVPRFDRSRIKCNGCKWPLTAPFYSCMKCSFFLHGRCAKLPERIGAYIHSRRTFGPREHNLRIEIISEDKKEGEGSWCSNCSNPCYGFSYKCEICEYRLDPNCTKIEEKIWHASHRHVLYLSEDDKPYSNKCNACRKPIEKKHTAYFCSICEFYLHIKCASFPLWSRHRFDRHELILMFKSAENELGEYICDICEDEHRDPNLWFYGCEKCDFAAHVDCICDH